MRIAGRPGRSRPPGLPRCPPRGRRRSPRCRATSRTSTDRTPPPRRPGQRGVELPVGDGVSVGAQDEGEAPRPAPVVLEPARGNARHDPGVGAWRAGAGGERHAAGEKGEGEEPEPRQPARPPIRPAVRRSSPGSTRPGISRGGSRCTRARSRRPGSGRGCRPAGGGPRPRARASRCSTSPGGSPCAARAFATASRASTSRTCARSAPRAAVGSSALEPDGLGECPRGRREDEGRQQADQEPSKPLRPHPANLPRPTTDWCDDRQPAERCQAAVDVTAGCRSA